jgi:hypothetical protein
MTDLSTDYNRQKKNNNTPIIKNANKNTNNNNNKNEKKVALVSNKNTNRKRMPIMNPLKFVIIEIFTYSTVRSASIYSIKVGLVYRAVQILILSYIIGYELIHNKAYQVSGIVSNKKHFYQETYFLINFLISRHGFKCSNIKSEGSGFCAT